MGGVRSPTEPPGAAIADEALRWTYIDALIDLHKLVEEYRLEVAVAHLLALDVREKVEQGLAERGAPNPIADRFGLPDESRAVLLAYMREPPSATPLFDDPHVLMTGDRRFSGWVAGQMLDSALFRGVAACDRLATLLWARAEIPLRQDPSGRTFLPTFTRRYVDQLRPRYANHPAWAAWEGLRTHPIYDAARDIRNRFTHKRRFASQLHGERIVSRLEGPTIAGVEIADHLALGLAMYNLDAAGRRGGGAHGGPRRTRVAPQRAYRGRTSGGRDPESGVPTGTPDWRALAIICRRCRQYGTPRRRERAAGGAPRR